MEEFIRNPQQFQLELPERVYYVPNFITSAEEDFIISRVNAAPKPKWTQLLNRRLQNWGGIPHPKGMVAEAIPAWLQIYLNRIDRLQLMKGNKPNHVLVNEYLPGQGIMPHLDGSLFYPTITTISCGSHTVINFKQKTDDVDNIETENKSEVKSILLERCSLLVVQREMYESHLHSIDNITSDVINLDIINRFNCSKIYDSNEILERQTRISLTIRHVPKTTKIKIKF